MNLTGGELYFIRETDVLSKSETRYVKIGIVKESETRTSEGRASEHQTGNPRHLHVHAIVKTPAITTVENIVHRLYAPLRISGEWFHLSPSELKSAVAATEEIATEILANLPALKQADKFNYELSTKKVLKATPSILKTYDQYQRAELQLKRCAEITKVVKEVFRSAINRGEDVGHMAILQVSAPRPKLNLDLLQENYPSLWEQFCETSESICGRFLITKAKATKLTLKDIHRELFNFALESESTIEKAVKSSLPKEDLFQKYLRLLGFQARAKLDKEIAEATLKMACKRAAGIEGVCQWPRTMKSGLVFDEVEFISAHPKIAKKFMITMPSIASLILTPKHAYAFSDLD